MTSSEDTSTTQQRDSGHPYVVVARRYRPQSFDELVGQQHVARALTSAIRSQRVGHAYLFTGARGVGKTSAARILAKALNCHRGPTADPCQQCDVCQSIAAGNDVDVLEIDGASNRGIDEIRQLRQNVMIRPSRVRFKIYIIDEVHMLTKEAFNALLKTLEEPPDHVKFIFATTEPNKIPITILSRCQRFDFAAIDSTGIRQRLREIAEAEGVRIADDALDILAARAGGSMRDSQSLLEQLLATGDSQIAAADVATLLGIASLEQVQQLAQLLVQRKAAAAIALLDASFTSGVDPGQLIDQLLGYFRDVMAVCVGCDAEQLRYARPENVAEVAQLASQLGIQTVLAIVHILDQSAARLRVSVHSRTLTELAIVRIAHLEDLDALSVLARDVAAAGPASATPREASDAAAKKNDGGDHPDGPLGQFAADARSARRDDGAPPSSTESLTPHEIVPPPHQDQDSLPATTVASGSSDLGEPNQIWKQMCSSLPGMLGDFAGQACDVKIADGNRLQVWFTDDVALAFCNREDNRRSIAHTLSATCGKTLQVDVQLRIDQSDAAAGQSPKRRSKRQLQQEAADHPFVKQALELFDADVSHVRYEAAGDGERNKPS